MHLGVARFVQVAVRGLALAALVLAVAGCGDDDAAAPATATHHIVVFNAENEDLNAYDATEGFRKQAVVTGGEDEHAGGLSLNGQICFDPSGSRRFVVADDAGQPAVAPGWVSLQLVGKRVGEYSVNRVGRLRPTFQGDESSRDPYGCATLSDGRVLTTDIGNNQSGPASGQLIVWFSAFDDPSPRYCKLDIAIATAGGIYVDAQDRIYVASARDTPGIFRYAPPFPAGDDAAHGCGGRDDTGAPLADTIRKDLFIPADGVAQTPNGVVGAGSSFYVSSIINGVIAEYGSDGKFIRRVLKPPPGEVLGPTPYSTGSPLGLTVDSTGSIYFADLGLVAVGGDIGPGRMLGTVRRIRFEDGQPLAPETMDQNLSFPDGVGVLEYDG